MTEYKFITHPATRAYLWYMLGSSGARGTGTIDPLFGLPNGVYIVAAIVALICSHLVERDGRKA